MTKMIQLKLMFLVTIFNGNCFIVAGLSLSDLYQRQEMLRDWGLLDLEAERLISALGTNDYENLFRLLNDNKTNINAMHNEQSLLHYMAYRYRDNIPEEREALRILLNRPDFEIDKKGTGRGDCGVTVLDMVVGWLSFSKILTFADHFKSSLSLVEVLLEKGANVELISKKTKDEFQSMFNIDIHQLREFVTQRRLQALR
ncbi:MAG TPA: hypothetical protein VLG50_00275 [Candidatus Saccharimonadales bacterium]|nr:hypothetical protein [Candidatus Saccharimonadales bacterium]